jgi:RNA polymerase sigma-70 factor (ECF subfamily)
VGATIGFKRAVSGRAMPSPMLLRIEAMAESGAMGRDRLAVLFETNFDFIARLLRRLGLREFDIDDALQEVFLRAGQKLDRVAAGSERSYLYGIAMRVASNLLRVRRRADARFESNGTPDTHPTGAPGPEDLVDQRRARALLDEVIGTMDIKQRAVFTLFELEGLTLAEIAALTGLPIGTVASRLHRARKEFHVELERLRARLATRGERK